MEGNTSGTEGVQVYSQTGTSGAVADLRPVEEGEEFPPVDRGQEAVKAVSNGSKSPEDLKDATAWFLSDQDANVMSTKRFEVNVSADPEVEHFVEWEVQAIARERIRQIRRKARVARRGGAEELDETKVNLMIAAEGTVTPDLATLAVQIGAQSPAHMLDRRFAHKPGLIDMIAGEVLAVSGYDEDDVRDLAAGKR